MLTKSEFFNNKTLWGYWFQKESLLPEEKEEYRNYVNDFIKDFEWSTSLLVTFSKVSLLSEIDSQYYVEEENEYIKIYLDFLELIPVVEEESYDLKVYHEETRTIYTIPMEDILSFSLAGWPRKGINPNKYIQRPWLLIEPIYKYLNNEITVATLKDEVEYYSTLYFDKSYFNQYMFEFIYPLINNYDYTREIFFRKVLKKLYEASININFIEFEELYEHNNPYIWFNNRNLVKGGKINSNPFNTLYGLFNYKDEDIIYHVIS